MAINSQQLNELLKMLQQTREIELTCPECLDELDRYTQSLLDGAPIEGLLTLVHQHLALCPQCNDQFKLILETLEAMNTDPPA